MAFDTLKQRVGGDQALSPIEIARHDLFTAREKLELLNDLKASATGAQDHGTDIGIEPGDIDEAIAVVRRDVQDGVGTETVFKGDF